MSEDSTKKILTAMGLVAGNLALLDETVEKSLLMIIGADVELGRAVTIYLGSRNSLAALRVVAKDVLEREVIDGELTPLSKRIDELRVERNAIVHTPWKETQENGGDPKVKTRVYEARKSTNPVERERTLSEILKTSDEISKAHTDFLNFVTNHFGIVP